MCIIEWRTVSFAANDLHRGHGFAGPDATFSRYFHDSDAPDHCAADPAGQFGNLQQGVCSAAKHTTVDLSTDCSRKQPRSYVPRFPMPMPPMTTRSLGATAPSRPRAELGIIIGAITAAPAAVAAVCRNRRRGTCLADFDMPELLIVGIAESSGRTPCGGAMSPERHQHSDTTSSLPGILRSVVRLRQIVNSLHNLTRVSPAAHRCPSFRGGKARVGDTSNNDVNAVTRQRREGF